MAKENGGPEKFVEILINSSKKQMIPWLGVALAVGMASTLGIQKVVNIFLERKAMSDEAVEAAKQELIQGIKDYDAYQDTIEEKVEIDEDNIN